MGSAVGKLFHPRPQRYNKRVENHYSHIPHTVIANPLYCSAYTPPQ
jgi:hypothetical protein